MRGKPLAERLGEGGQEADRVGHDAEMGEIEDRRVLVGVDGHDQVGALDADAMLDRARDAGGDIELGTDGLAGLADPAAWACRARKISSS